MAEYFARGVARRIEYDCYRFGGYRFLDFIHGTFEFFDVVVVFHDNRYTATHLNHLFIIHIVRGRYYNFIARVDSS